MKIVFAGRAGTDELRDILVQHDGAPLLMLTGTGDEVAAQALSAKVAVIPVDSLEAIDFRVGATRYDMAMIADAARKAGNAMAVIRMFATTVLEAAHEEAEEQDPSSTETEKLDELEGAQSGDGEAVNKITIAYVQSCVDAIAECADEDERAHILEDDLHQEVLFAIANGTAEDPRECARLALSTQSIDFSRWYA